MSAKKYSTQIFPIAENATELPKREATFCYSFNIADKNKMVGFADYVFVASFDEVWV